MVMDFLNIIEVLERIETRIEEQETLMLDGTIYESKEELLDDINDFILELEEGNAEAIEFIDIHFLKGSTFDILANNHGWQDDLQAFIKEYEHAK